MCKCKLLSGRLVDCLATELTAYRNARMQASALAQASKDGVDALSNHMTTSLQFHEKLTAKMQDVPSQVADIKQHLQQYVLLQAFVLLRSTANQQSSGLSPVEQRNMFCLLEEALAERRGLKSQNQTLIAQNQTLEMHLLDWNAAVQQQREIPAQVMLRRPVILIDAFEENRLPFHLEFITSFEALYAVLTVRFKHRGDTAMDRIRWQMFDLYESSKQKRIPQHGPWATAFFVSTACRAKVKAAKDNIYSPNSLSKGACWCLLIPHSP
jgi:hypothetical protein